MKKTTSLLLFLLLSMLPHAALGQMFKHIEVKDGLPNNQVNSIFKDSDGFMWFGTASGLARYDGYQFKVFRTEMGNPKSIPDNFVERIFEDADGRLWMRTGERGYTFFDRSTETFVPSVPQFLKHYGIDGVPELMHMDVAKNIWLVMSRQGGLYCLRHGATKARHLAVGGKALPKGRITDMADTNDGMLLVYDTGLLVCVDVNVMSVKWMRNYIPSVLQRSGKDIFSLFIDRDDDVWIYSVMGVWMYRPSTRQCTSLEQMGVRSEPHNIVRSVAQDKDGRIWMGNDPNGITIFDKRTHAVTRLLHDPNDERSLPNNTIFNLYCDADGMMWVGTYKKGVACYDESIYKFRLQLVGDVNAIAEDGSDGCMWLGLNDGGLLNFNPKTGSKRLYTHNSSGNSLASNTIVALHKGRDNRLWIGTFWGGLDCLEGTAFKHYRHREGDANSLANDNVWSLTEDADGNIWIGTLGGGLQCLDPRTGRFTTYSRNNSGLASGYVTSVCMGRNGRLIIGYGSDGIGLLNLNTHKITNLHGNRAGTRRFTCQNVNQVYEDSRGLIWIATRDGLNLYDPATDWLKTDFMAQNSSDRYVYGIVEDSNHAMWVTTAGGLVNITLTAKGSPRTFACRMAHYGYKDGLQGSGFNQRSICRLRDGEIVMGGLYGINTFVPDGMRYNRLLPRVLFTGFQLFNEYIEVGKEYAGRVILNQSLNSGGEVHLNCDQNVFTVLFATNNYVLPDKTVYHYKLEGFDKEWLTCGADMHRATYTNLSPGKYTLHVKAVNSDGLAGIDESVLTINIHPPFWLSPIACVFYVVVVILAVMLYLRYMPNGGHRTYHKGRHKRKAKVKSLVFGASSMVRPRGVKDMLKRIKGLIMHGCDNGVTPVVSPPQIDPEPSRIEITSVDEQLVVNAIKYVEDNISRPELSVEELSQALGMSRVHLYKKLNQLTGKSPIEFIRVIRLKRAAQLLRESQLNVSEIAYQVGFNSPKYFSKYFREEFGVLPSTYRETEGK